MTVLVVAEVAQGRLAADALARTLQAVQGLGPVHVLVASGGPEAAAAAAGLAGVDRVLLADDAALAHGLAEATAALVADLGSACSHIAAPATAFGRSVLPRAAALLGVMIVPDVMKIVDAETFERPVYAGNAVQTVRSADAIKVLTVRTAGFSPVGGRDAPAPVEAVAAPAVPVQPVWVEDRVSASDRPELASARIVVSGGRGIGSRENFALVEGLADRLGAAVGASRAAVDSGFAPNDWQVGQTGKVVAPDLYVAIGISGAIQHLAGMKDSKVIVAINKDEEAPIFSVADYGLVADLFAAVPELSGKV
ncbi:FAD-binding protein [Pseudoxanthobacter sp.]|uniref:electron transfer flavoprotein subunit alpha/FixB family protein n=1 Tax=Pseudoxanthobacter sp. TaxID=1925742 RepID=UPI002FE08F84